MYQDLLLIVKNTELSSNGYLFFLSPFLLNFVFLFQSSSLPGSPSPTSLFAFCSSWFLSHFPGGSTSSPIRVAAEQETARMGVLEGTGFWALFFILMIYSLMSLEGCRAVSCDPCSRSWHLLKVRSIQGQAWAPISLKTVHSAFYLPFFLS